MKNVFRIIIFLILFNLYYGIFLQESNATSCQGKWPELELFIPIHVVPNNSRNNEIYDVFLKSLLFFWPLEVSNTSILFLSDKEVQNNNPALDSFKGALNGISKIKPYFQYRIDYNDPKNGRYGGHDRQQLLMFYADNYTNSEYIGFCDSDALFNSYVDIGDLFENGKPVVNGRLGGDGRFDHFWNQVPQGTKQFMGGAPEPVRCMSYFPVIIKRIHLPLMRAHISKMHHGKSFDDVFRDRNSIYSQFNVMCAYMFYFHRDEYVWYMHPTSAGYSSRNTVPGQVSDMSIYNQSMLSIPKPRVSIHLRYHDNRDLNGLVRQGFCYSPPFDNKPQFCDAYKGSSYNPEMHKFEHADWNRVFTPQVLKQTHNERNQRIKNCNHTYDMSLFNLQ